MSNLDILEQKISQAIERLQQVNGENKELRDQLNRLEGENHELQTQVGRMREQLQSADANGADLDSLKGRVDGILSKFELLDL